jgi:hypothetical protein
LIHTTGAVSAQNQAQEIRLFSKMRNEKLRLPAFLRHYRALGVNRFFIVDNGSTDGSTEYLFAQQDVQVFRTGARFREARGGTDWLNALLQEFGVGSWCVTVDVDELLWFPGCENTDLHRLTAYFDAHGYEALACLLLDLYPDGPIGKCNYTPEQDLLSAAPYFDIGPYTRTKPAPGRSPSYGIFGGVRGRVFYPEARAKPLGWRLRFALFTWIPGKIPFLRQWSVLRKRRPVISPILTKVPLVKWTRDSKYLDVNHFVSPKVVAPESGVLLHFKFLQDFHERAVQEMARGEYFGGASEYRRYCDKLKADPNLSFMYEGSTRLESTAQLVHLGLMKDTQAWAQQRNASMSEQANSARRGEAA